MNSARWSGFVSFKIPCPRFAIYRWVPNFSNISFTPLRISSYKEKKDQKLKQEDFSHSLLLLNVLYEQNLLFLNIIKENISIMFIENIALLHHIVTVCTVTVISLHSYSLRLWLSKSHALCFLPQMQTSLQDPYFPVKSPLNLPHACNKHASAYEHIQVKICSQMQDYNNNNNMLISIVVFPTCIS